jgi:DNA primase large subunit
MEDADQIKQVLAICEMDDDLDVWVQKASDILNERSKWHMQNRKIYEENPQLIQMIEEQWMDAIYQILLSLKEDSNQLKKDKKAAAIQVIVSQLMKSNQEALEGYVKNRMQQDGIAIP